MRSFASGMHRRKARYHHSSCPRRDRIVRFDRHGLSRVCAGKRRAACCSGNSSRGERFHQPARLYEGTPTNEGGSTPWGGFQWGPPTTYAMGVAFHDPDVSMTRHWLPSNDIPSDKATFDMTYDVPEGYAVAGTGLLQSVRHNGGRVQYHWFEPHPTATYLVTFAVSNYAVVRNTWNGIPIEIYVALRIPRMPWIISRISRACLTHIQRRLDRIRSIKSGTA